MREKTGSNQNLDLVDVNACIKFGEIYRFVLMILNRNENLNTSIKGHNHVSILRNMAGRFCQNKYIYKVWQKSIDLFSRY